VKIVKNNCSFLEAAAVRAVVEKQPWNYVQIVNGGIARMKGIH
jgi:hypothetical protein